MKTQAEFIETIRAATEHLWSHRRQLRTIAVRIGFWPDHPNGGAPGGLIISATPTLDTHGNEGLLAWRQEIIPWDRIATIDAAELIDIIDRVCQPSHEMIEGKAAAQPVKE